MDKTGRVFACSDIHGQLDLFKQIKSYLQPEDKVYFLGDAMDRGPHGWDIMKEILCDDRFIYLQGNHEAMLIDAIKEYYRWENFGSKCNLVICNGGNDTLNSAFGEPAEFALGWARQLEKLPTHAEYINKSGKQILLSHAGFTPELDEDNEIIYPTNCDLIWDRNHYIYQPFNSELFPNTVVVHGHTPIPYLIKDLRLSAWVQTPGPLWYDDRHKVCLDNAAFATNQTYLLDLDTLDHITFTSK